MRSGFAVFAFEALAKRFDEPGNNPRPTLPPAKAESLRKSLRFLVISRLRKELDELRIVGVNTRVLKILFQPHNSLLRIAVKVSVTKFGNLYMRKLEPAI